MGLALVSLPRLAQKEANSLLNPLTLDPWNQKNVPLLYTSTQSPHPLSPPPSNPIKIVDVGVGRAHTLERLRDGNRPKQEPFL